MTRWFAVLATTLVLAPAATAAAPNYMLVGGHLLANWSENGQFLSSLVNAPIVDWPARERPRFDVAEFWGWGNRPVPTRPEQANQHGWFYPAHRGAPALFVLVVNGTRRPRAAPARALAILARHGVPTRR